MRSEQTRTYYRNNCIVFLKTKEAFGGLSNMAGGFPLRVNGMRILTSEALYQACRFPHLPNVQRLIIQQHSPMTAKMKSKPYRDDSRPDWDRVRVKVMRWCLRVKLAQNWRAFSELLLATGERPIVEESRKDDFWGAKPVDELTLVGMNVLGRLLMELRESVKAESRDSFLQVEPIVIPDFLLGERPIGTVAAQGEDVAATPAQPVQHPSRGYVGSQELAHPSLFDASVVKEAVPPAYLYPDVSAKVVRIADLKPYAGYKDSGLQWLGQVPGHWQPTKLKYVFKRIIGGSTPASGNREYWNGDVTWVTPADVSRSERLRQSIRQISRAGMLSCSTEMVPKGSVVLTSRAPVGNVAIADVDLCTNQGCKALIPDHAVVAPMFGFWLLSIMKAELQSLSTGTTFSEISTSRLGSAFGVLPPPTEQAAIVGFLGWANGRLERTIRAKRKVIALLTEQKQAIIHRAVTRGLDPSVPLKPSGIHWLGDIPQHWEVERTKNVFRLRTQKSGLAHGMELLSIYTHIGVRPRKDLEQKGNKASTTDNYWIVRKGDLIVNKLLAWMGAVGSSDYEGVTSPAYDILMPIRPLCSDYYHHLFRTKLYLQLFKQRSRGIMDMRLRLYFDQLGQIPVPFPPVDEQAAIVAFYVEATADLTATISQLEREIDLLREYRTRLVADVVTGKLDVREAAARLPAVEEAPTVEPELAGVDETIDDLAEETA